LDRCIAIVAKGQRTDWSLKFISANVGLGAEGAIVTFNVGGDAGQGNAGIHGRGAKGGPIILIGDIDKTGDPAQGSAIDRGIIDIVDNCCHIIGNLGVLPGECRPIRGMSIEIDRCGIPADEGIHQTNWFFTRIGIAKDQCRCCTIVAGNGDMA